MTTIRTGKSLVIKAGTFVRRDGQLAKRTQDSVVTVRRAEPARGGKTRVYWKSKGLIASALV